MDYLSQNPSSLNCELRIMRAKNFDFLTTGTLFVRCYLLNENNQRIQLNTREIPSSSTCGPNWNELISLECSGAKNVIDKLSKQNVVFELRWRNTSPILGMFSGSKLLGRAEVSWMEVLESKELSIEKWVTTVSKNSRIFEDLKPAAIQIGRRLQYPDLWILRKELTKSGRGIGMSVVANMEGAMTEMMTFLHVLQQWRSCFRI